MDGLPVTVEILTGDAEATLRTLPDASCHMAVTSPPFFGLRDYQVDGQIGLEASPSEWVERLVGVFREVGRVLRPDGTLWLEVGDSYTSGGRDSYGPGKPDKNIVLHNAARPPQPPGLKPKDLVGAPWLLAFALRADGWYLRSDIIFARPNPMPESVRDRPTKAHSYVFLLSRQPRYFYDASAIAEPSGAVAWPGIGARHTAARAAVISGGTDESEPMDVRPNRNARSVWTIPTQGLAEPHYAAFPEELARRCILAGTSERGVCPECGAPWRRIVERELTNPGNRSNNGRYDGSDPLRRGFEQRLEVATSTVGWEPGCDRDHDPVPATVLDPFLGSGTTALVARKLGRNCVGIELSPEYVEIAWRRLRDPDALNRAAHAADGPAQLALPDKEAM